MLKSRQLGLAKTSAISEKWWLIFKNSGFFYICVSVKLLFLHGGYQCCWSGDEEPVITETCWMWSPGGSEDLGRWLPGPSLPEPLAAGGLVSLGDSLLWVGGHPKLTVNPTNKTWFLESLSGDWREGPQLSTERAWHCSTALNRPSETGRSRPKT